MVESESTALPLGDAPIINECNYITFFSSCQVLFEIFSFFSNKIAPNKRQKYYLRYKPDYSFKFKKFLHPTTPPDTAFSSKFFANSSVMLQASTQMLRKAMQNKLNKAFSNNFPCQNCVALSFSTS